MSTPLTSARSISRQATLSSQRDNSASKAAALQLLSPTVGSIVPLTTSAASTRAATPAKVGPHWSTVSCADLLRAGSLPEDADSTASQQQQHSVTFSDTPTHLHSGLTLQLPPSTRSHTSELSSTVVSAPLILDAKLPGNDVLMALCSAGVDMAAPVYQQGTATTGGVGDWVGMVDILDVSIFLLRQLQKVKSASFSASPIMDQTPLEVASDAALLVDLSGTSPFVPFDVAPPATSPSSSSLSSSSLPTPISAAFKHFASGTTRLVAIEGLQAMGRTPRTPATMRSGSGGPAFVEPSLRYRGLLTQQGALQFLVRNACAFGAVGKKTIAELNLIQPTPANLPSADWSDSTLLSALSLWLGTASAGMGGAAMGSLPLVYKGGFVDMLTPADLVGVLSKRIRGDFYRTVHETLTRERARVHALRNPAAAEAGHSRSGSGSTPLSYGLSGSESTTSIRSDSTLVSSSGSSDVTISSDTPSKKPFISPDSGVRIPLRSNRRTTGGIGSVDFAHMDEFERAKAMAAAMHTPASSAGVNTVAPSEQRLHQVRQLLNGGRPTSRHGSRDASPDGSSSHSSTASNAPGSADRPPSAALQRRGSHTRRSTMPTSLLSSLSLNVNAAPAANQTSAGYLNDGSPVTSPTSGRQTARRTAENVLGGGGGSGTTSSRRSTGVTSSNSSSATKSASSTLSSSSIFADTASSSLRRGLDMSVGSQRRRLERGGAAGGSIGSAADLAGSNVAASDENDSLTDLERRVRKRSTMPVGSNLSAGMASWSAKNASAAVAATMGSAASSSPAYEPRSLSPSPTLTLSQAQHSIQLLSLVNEGAIVRGEDTVEALIRRMVEARSTCLWSVNRRGRVDGYVTANDVFRCLLGDQSRSDTAAGSGESKTSLAERMGLHLP